MHPIQIACNVAYKYVDLICVEPKSKTKDVASHTKVNFDTKNIKREIKTQSVLKLCQLSHGFLLDGASCLYRANKNFRSMIHNTKIIVKSFSTSVEVHNILHEIIDPAIKYLESEATFSLSYGSSIIQITASDEEILKNTIYRYEYKFEENYTNSGVYFQRFIVVNDMNILCTHSRFQCYDGTCIAAFMVCDGYNDCDGDEDEQNCERTHAIEYMICDSNKVIHLSKMCDSVGDCTDLKDESNRCRVMELHKKDNASIINIDKNCLGGICPEMQEIPIREALSSIVELNMSCNDDFKTSIFRLHEMCILRLSNNLDIMPCQSGRHLQHCVHHSCTGYFKCPESYCLPMSYVCNK